MIREYRAICGLLVRYWQIYGGWPALFRSPYFHFAILLAGISSQTWLTPGWWEQVLDVNPNLLGFTLGGFAIFLGFGDERFKALISGVDPEEAESYSPYLEICATFLHFILVQWLAILAALFCRALYIPVPVSFAPALLWLEVGRVIMWALSYGIFLYSITLLGATAIAMFRITETYDAFHTRCKHNATESQVDGEVTRKQRT